MHEEGLLPVSGPAYDIPSLDALRYAFEREGSAHGRVPGGQGNWSSRALLARCASKKRHGLAPALPRSEVAQIHVVGDATHGVVEARFLT